ncbi:MAG: EAL domain-containing protein [Lachnospiraceae bacterium]|nr:EAL domain-containing protein [Lachnospiraceae bacterium]
MGKEKKYSVLVVDDSDINRDILNTILSADFKIYEATDGIQALEIMRDSRKKIDLCLLDIMMPRMDGYEVLSVMNKEHLIDYIPVIVISGEQEADKVEKTYDLGALDYILKPFEPRIVRRRVLATVMLFEKQRELSYKLKAQMEENSRNVDEKTGLLSYASFFYACDKLIESDKIVEDYFMVAIDIEHFRLFNDWFGREEGDIYLQELADCLKEYTAGTRAICGYLGGDNFALFAPYNLGLIEQIQERIIDMLEKYGQSIGFGPMYGIFEARDSLYDAQLMYDNAVTAMSDIPGNYHNRIAIYDPRLLKKTGDELIMLSDVQRGMDAKEFRFFLQPKVNMLNGKIVGAEALVRWAHRTKGLISPGKFVPILEDNGFITNLDRYIWEEVCKWLRSWIDRGREPLPISVNVSQIDVFAGDVAEYFEDLIKKYDLSPNMIDIEITESAYAKEYSLINKTVDRLRKAGFKVLLDDFGSAYSSLNMLRNLKVDVLKLDMKFLDTNEDRENKEKGISIIDSIVGMSNQLGLPIIVEGVERLDQVEVLTKLGCVYAQGYYYYKPMPLKKFEELIKDNSKVEREGDGKVSNYKPLHVLEFLRTNLFTDSMINEVLGPFAFFEIVRDKLSVVRVNEQYYRVFSMLGEVTEDEIIASADRLIDNNSDFIEIFNNASNSKSKSSSGCVIYNSPKGTAKKLYFRVFFLHEREGRKLFCSTIWDITDL